MWAVAAAPGFSSSPLQGCLHPPAAQRATSPAAMGCASPAAWCAVVATWRVVGGAPGPAVVRSPAWCKGKCGHEETAWGGLALAFKHARYQRGLQDPMGAAAGRPECGQGGVSLREARTAHRACAKCSDPHGSWWGEGKRCRHLACVGRWRPFPMRFPLAPDSATHPPLLLLHAEASSTGRALRSPATRPGKPAAAPRCCPPGQRRYRLQGTLQGRTAVACSQTAPDWPLLLPQVAACGCCC